MPVRIRLAPKGKKGQKFYHIVVADSRAPVKGRFIEKIGTYSPTKQPAEISLNSEKALRWLANGAIPSNTTKSILRKYGVLYRLHLHKGVLKGALTEKEALVKFNDFLKMRSEKELKIESQKLDPLTIDSIAHMGTKHVLESISYSESMVDAKVISSINKKVKDKIKSIIYSDTISIKENPNFPDEELKNTDMIFDINISINNADGKTLKLNNQYDLSIKVSVKDPVKQKHLFDNLGVLISPEKSKVLGNTYQKFSYFDENQRSTSLSFIPFEKGSSVFMIDILRKSGTIQSIPIEFNVVA